METIRQDITYLLPNKLYKSQKVKLEWEHNQKTGGMKLFLVSYIGDLTELKKVKV